MGKQFLDLDGVKTLVNGVNGHINKVVGGIVDDEIAKKTKGESEDRLVTAKELKTLTETKGEINLAGVDISDAMIEYPNFTKSTLRIMVRNITDWATPKVLPSTFPIHYLNEEKQYELEDFIKHIISLNSSTSSEGQNITPEKIQEFTYLKSEVYTKAEVDEKISEINTDSDDIELDENTTVLYNGREEETTLKEFVSKNVTITRDTKFYPYSGQWANREETFGNLIDKVSRLESSSSGKLSTSIAIRDEKNNKDTTLYDYLEDMSKDILFRTRKIIISDTKDLQKYLTKLVKDMENNIMRDSADAQIDNKIKLSPYTAVRTMGQDVSLKSYIQSLVQAQDYTIRLLEKRIAELEKKLAN